MVDIDGPPDWRPENSYFSKIPQKQTNTNVTIVIDEIVFVIVSWDKFHAKGQQFSRNPWRSFVY